MSREGCAKEMGQAEARSGAQLKSFKIVVAMSSFSFSVVLPLKPQVAAISGPNASLRVGETKLPMGRLRGTRGIRLYRRQEVAELKAPHCTFTLGS